MFRRTPNPSGEMPFLDHLEELRWRILHSLAALFVGTAVGFAIVHYLGIMEILVRPVRPLLETGQLAYFSPVTPFFVTLKLSLVVGLILAFPVVVYQAWAFLSPGLTPEERKIIVPSLYFGLVLFCAGVAMGYYLVLPLALIFLTGFQQEYLTATLEVGQYLAFVTKLLVAFGVAFELPVGIMILSAMGLVTPRFLKEKRRHAIVGMTVMATLLTPGDLASTVLMILPMMVLYEGSIVLSAIIQRRQREGEDSGEIAAAEPPAEAMGVEGPWVE